MNDNLWGWPLAPSFLARYFPELMPGQFVYVGATAAGKGQAMSTPQEFEFRVHRDDKTLFGSWVQLGWNNEAQVHIGLGAQTLSVHVCPHRYASTVEIDGRIAVRFSLKHTSDQEWHRVPFLFDGEEWLVEYRRRLP